METGMRLPSIPQPYLIAGAGIIAVVLIAVGIAFVNGAFDASEEKGRLGERADVLGETIERVETGNEIREEFGGVGADAIRARYCECLRSARTPENCVGLLPQREGDNSGARPKCERP